MLLSRDGCLERVREFWLTSAYEKIFDLPRWGWVKRKIKTPENVGEHSLSAALLVLQFRKQIENIWANIQIIQDILLIHDLGEWDPEVWDIIPSDNVPESEKNRKEWKAIYNILHNNQYLINLWLDYEAGRSIEWKIAKEIDKLQAIEKSFEYEMTQWKIWITKEFFEFYLEKDALKSTYIIEFAQNLLNKLPTTSSAYTTK